MSKSTQAQSINPAKAKGVDLDGHYIIFDQIAGITKVMTTPFNPEVATPVDVFFDLLTKSQATLRVARPVPVGTPEEMGTGVDAAMTMLEALRQQLIDAIELT